MNEPAITPQAVILTCSRVSDHTSLIQVRQTNEGVQDGKLNITYSVEGGEPIQFSYTFAAGEEAAMNYRGMFNASRALLAPHDVDLSLVHKVSPG